MLLKEPISEASLPLRRISVEDRSALEPSSWRWLMMAGVRAMEKRGLFHTPDRRRICQRFAYGSAPRGMAGGERVWHVFGINFQNAKAVLQTLQKGLLTTRLGYGHLATSTTFMGHAKKKRRLVRVK